jgi:hypothetical protein
LKALRKLQAFLKALIVNWASGVMFLLALGSTFATYIPSFYPGFHIPRWVPAAVFIMALLAASFRLFIQQDNETQDAKGRIKELERQIADFQNDDVRERRRMMTGLIAEVEGNIFTARNNVAGMPGNRIYIRPSVQFWRDNRGNLEFLDGELLAEIRDQYAQVERWYGIVEGGARPDIGNRDISGITIMLQAQLPPLLERLRATLVRMP